MRSLKVGSMTTPYTCTIQTSSGDTLMGIWALAHDSQEAEKLAAQANEYVSSSNGFFVAGSFMAIKLKGYAPAVVGTLLAN
jgi:hypothetical protein